MFQLVLEVQMTRDDDHFLLSAVSLLCLLLFVPFVSYKKIADKKERATKIVLK